MKQKYMSILVIFNILIFSIITVFSGIMLFRASYAASNNTVWDGTIGTSFAGGNGTSSSPYLISNGKQLAYFIKKCNESAPYRSKYYKLTADIYLNDGYFDFKSKSEYLYYKNGLKYYINKNKYYDTNIYTSQHEVGSFNQLPVSKFEFTGNFDGNSKMICGMFYYSEEYDDYFGLFYSLIDNNGRSATIASLKVVNSSITANSMCVGLIGNINNANVLSTLYSGLIYNMSNDIDSSVGLIGGTSHDKYGSYLDLISVSGTIIGNNAGGLIGRVIGITSSLNSVTFFVYRFCNYATIYGGYTSSPINNRSKHAGGIIGIIFSNYNFEFSFKNVFNMGTVSSQGGYSGGFFGYVDSSKTIIIKNCFNGSISNTSGQLVGYYLNYDNTKFTFSGSNYYIRSGSRVVGNYSGSVSGFTYKNSSQLTKSVLKGMDYNEYPNGGWFYKDDRPYIYFDDKDGPNIDVSINISNESKLWNQSKSGRSMAVLYDNDEHKIVDYTSNDSNGVALVEYRVVENIFLDSHFGINFNDSLLSSSSSSSIDISNNFCSVVYVRVTDYYGNVSYAYTDLIMSGYETTKYIDSESDNEISVDKTIMSDSILNINFKQQFDVINNSFVSKTEKMYQYLFLTNKLPVGTKLSLYDSRDKNTYVLYIDDNTEYGYSNTFYIDLAKFHNVLNPSSFYNNDYDSFSTSISFNCDITISFDFPNSLSDINYYFSNGTDFSSLSNISDSGISFITSDKIDTIVTCIDDYYDTDYSLKSNSTDINIQTNSMSNTYTLNFDIIKTIYKTVIDGQDYFISSKRSGYKKFKLYIELTGPNNEKLSPLVGANFKYTLISNGVSKIFNNKTNSVAMADFVINNWDYIGPASDGNDEYTYNFDVKVDLVGNNFRNILPNNNYKLKFWILPSDDYSTVNSVEVPVTIDSPKVFDGYSFQSSIDRNDRIFDHETGKNLNNNNYITYNYSYNLYSGNSQFLQYRFLKQNNNVYTSVNPSTVLQPNSYSLSGSGSYFKLNSNACLAGTTGCYERLILKDNIPEGSYSVEVFLMRGNTAISQDYFNFIVK